MHCLGEHLHITAETSAVVVAPDSFIEVNVDEYQKSPNSVHFNANVNPSRNNKCEIIFARFNCNLSKDSDVQYKVGVWNIIVLLVNCIITIFYIFVF